MAKYLIKANYNQSGLTGLLAEGGSSRRAALTNTIESLGGSLEALYYAFGDTDLYAIADLPDVASAAAFSLQVSAAGAIDVDMTVLVTPEAVDEASKKELSYRPPGD
ncbi:MAG: GYD domain-containing protein [Gammaproteobacteria bacterium]|nr:GYD domain-containing protein [Gammaproteobacteria bacterium]